MTLKWELAARQHPAWPSFACHMKDLSRDYKGRSWGCGYRKWDWDMFRSGWEAKELKQEEWIGYPIDQ